MANRVAVIMVTLTLLVSAGRAAAADDRARRAFVDGQRAYNLGHWDEAIQGFETSYRLSGDPILLFNLAQAHRQAGHTREALTTYRAYLRDRPEAPNRATVEARIVELELRLRAPAANPPPAAAPSSADISNPFPAVAARAESRPPLPAWVPWAGVGVTAGLVVGAVLATRSAQDRYDQLRATCGPCPESQIDSVKSKVVVRNLLWAAAGVGAALTGVGFYLSKQEAGAMVAVRF